MRGPGATGFTHVGVVTTATEAPQSFATAIAVDAELVSLPPDLFQIKVTDVAARVSIRGQRRAALDRAVSFNPERILSGITTRPVDSIVSAAAPHRLIRTEVTDVIPRLEQKSTVSTFLEQLSQQRHQFKQFVRLKQEVRIVCGAPHRHRELDLPVLGARFDEEIHQFAELWNDERSDLCVDAGSDAALLNCVKRPESRIKRAFHSPHAIVNISQTIDRDAESLQTRINRRLDAVFS